MSATESSTGNSKTTQKLVFRSLRAQIVYTHYRKKSTTKSEQMAPLGDGF